MTITAITAGFNIGLNYLFIFGKGGFPPMGIRGAALATVLAELAGFVLFFAIFLSKNNRGRYLTSRVPHISYPLFRRIF